MDELQPISAIARELGIEPKFVEPHAQHKAKVALDAIRSEGPQGKLVVVTSITPTPSGEGKTTISIGLAQALRKLGKRTAVTLREPPLSPIFGIKDGARDSLSRVVPEDEINVHFNGDSHAVVSAHNLLAALVDNAALHRTIPGLHPEGITWRRVTNVEDRALQHIAIGLGGAANGPIRETGFDMVATSEIMAVLALAEGVDNLRERLERITVAYTDDEEPVTAADLDAVGPLMALLRQALLPNLVQTLEGSPAFVHTGPSGNIAHGSSSVLADRLALGYTDYVITESGFGADLGFEKFMHIKARSSGLRPSAAVLVATVRALKSHGGSPPNAWDRADPIAVRIGAANLEATIGIVRSFGLPVVVAINRFPTDTPEELVIMQDVAIAAGASAAVTCSSFSEGGDGTIELGEAMIRVTGDHPPEPGYLYRADSTIRQKVHVLATKVYGADNVRWSPLADRRLGALEQRGLGSLPVCMAKTHLSLSHDPALKGRPANYTFEINDVRVATGAGFVYPIAGPALAMPGLPLEPHKLGVGEDGPITGL